MERRGISEVVGTVALIGVVVVGMVIVNLVIFSAPTQTRIPSLEASMTNRSTLITIVHQGGDSIPQGQFRILVDGIDQTQNFTNSGSYPWSLGETLSFNDSGMPLGAVMIYNGTGPMNGGTVILETRFPWGVYVAGDQGGIGGGGGGGGGGSTNVTPLPPGSPWFDCSWGYRKNLTINHLKVSGDQANFPVLVSLTADPELATYAQANGNDIVFTAADGTTKLSHEIESYSSGTLVAWVNVPLVSSSTDTTIMMYYGDPAAPGQQNPTGTWANNYTGVWHLDEAGSGSTTDYLDSSMNGNYGQAGGGTAGAYPSQAAGQIGNGQSFDGANDYIATTNSFNNPVNFTESVWFKTGTTASGKFIGFENIRTGQGAGTFDRMIYINSTGYVAATIWSGGVRLVGSNTKLNDSAWHYASFTYDGTGLRLYIDGSYLGMNTGTPQNYVGYLRMGSWALNGWPSAANGYYSGYLDEAHYAGVTRSLGWITTEYNNQGSPSTFFLPIGGAVGSSCSATPTVTTTPAPWYDCNWGYRKKITIDHTKVTGNQTDFPVLVSLASDTGLQGHADSGGDDIFFTAADGTTKLSHEIENYTPSTGGLTAWVKVPSLSSAVDTVIYLNYGNPSAPSMQNPTDVWSNSFVVVQHMNGPSYRLLRDSTSNHNDVTYQNGTPVYSQAGMVASAVSFDGIIAGVDMPDAASLDLTSQVTECAWIRPGGSGSFWNRIVAKSFATNNWPYSMYALLYDDKGRIRQEIGSGGNQYYTNGNTILSGTTWYYACGSYDHTALRVYLNGVSDNSTPLALASNIDTNNMNLSIARAGYASNYFNGTIDEVRVSSVARSAGWIKTEYTNMNGPATFSSLGSEEVSPCTPLPTTTTVPTTVPTPNPPWYQCSWTHRKLITINNTMVAGTQTNFPVLINITD
ncbi:MAG TPA: DUF2341 domain-containing protein, partial [Methanomicrobiales archaeon]|nr:DUF2341 domain-containing protein [Methanomicrobiales archaeon]